MEARRSLCATRPSLAPNCRWLADLGLCVLERRAIRRQPAMRWASMRSSRESASTSSPRRARSTISVLRRAESWTLPDVRTRRTSSAPLLRGIMPARSQVSKEIGCGLLSRTHIEHEAPPACAVDRELCAFRCDASQCASSTSGLRTTRSSTVALPERLKDEFDEAKRLFLLGLQKDDLKLICVLTNGQLAEQSLCPIGWISQRA